MTAGGGGAPGVPGETQASLPGLGVAAGARPVLKWAGGKARLVPVLRVYIPRCYNRYIEPFFGGGALFFHLVPKSALLADSNPELVSFYRAVRDIPEEVLRELGSLRVTRLDYYRLRGLKPESLPPAARAARFLYLNKTCYNGLYRVNKKGQFNTPFGGYEDVCLVSPPRLRAASRALGSARIVCADYRAALASAEPGDFVYLDPPYMPVGKYSDFKRYTKEFFHEEDHRQLAAEFRRLHGLGCYVVLSNSCHPTVVELYRGFQQRVVRMHRFVNSRGDGRGEVNELLISSFAPEAGA